MSCINVFTITFSYSDNITWYNMHMNFKNIFKILLSRYADMIIKVIDSWLSWNKFKSIIHKNYITNLLYSKHVYISKMLQKNVKN